MVNISNISALDVADRAEFIEILGFSGEYDHQTIDIVMHPLILTVTDCSNYAPFSGLQ
jgi:hypothetical protein